MIGKGLQCVLRLLGPIIVVRLLSASIGIAAVWSGFTVPFTTTNLLVVHNNLLHLFVCMIMLLMSIS